MIECDKSVENIMKQTKMMDKTSQTTTTWVKEFEYFEEAKANHYRKSKRMQKLESGKSNKVSRTDKPIELQNLWAEYGSNVTEEFQSHEEF